MRDESRDGLTHVELLMALAVMAAFALAAHEALRITERRTHQIFSRGDVRMDTALAVIGRDLRSTFLSSSDERTVFVTREEEEFGRLDFVRVSSPDGRPALMEVGFGVRRDANGRSNLYRRFSPGLDGDPLNGGAERVLLSDISAFEVKAFDGNAWRTEWGWDANQRRATIGIRGAPLLVSVRMTLGKSGERRESTRIFPVLVPLLDRCLHG